MKSTGRVGVFVCQCEVGLNEEYRACGSLCRVSV